MTISGFSKTYNMTGWRIGYACAPQPIADKMALVNVPHGEGGRRRGGGDGGERVIGGAMWGVMRV